MIFDSDGTTTVVHQEKTSLEEFLKSLEEGYPKIKSDHIIVNLFSFSKLSSDELLEFLELSARHRKAEKSFVLVSDKVILRRCTGRYFASTDLTRSPRHYSNGRN